MWIVELEQSCTVCAHGGAPPLTAPSGGGPRPGERSVAQKYAGELKGDAAGLKARLHGSRNRNACLRYSQQSPRATKQPRVPREPAVAVVVEQRSLQKTSHSRYRTQPQTA